MRRARLGTAMAVVGLVLPALLLATPSGAAMSATTSNAGSSLSAATISPASSASASARLTCAIDVTWSATPTTWASGHAVYRSGTLIATVTPRTTTSYTDTSSALKAGLNYTYQVRAYYGNWVSTAASTNTVTGPAICGGGA